MTEEFEFLIETLSEFMKMEAEGKLDSEESAADAIVGAEQMVSKCEKYEKKSKKIHEKMTIEVKSS